MKKLKFRIALLALMVSLSYYAEAQSSSVFKLQADKIETKILGDRSVYFVNQADLHKGVNQVNLISGEKLEVTIKKGEIVNWKLTDKNGKSESPPVIRKPSNTGAVEFQCGVLFCQCSGHADCTDMLSVSGLCGSAICIDDGINLMCGCLRSY